MLVRFTFASRYLRAFAGASLLLAARDGFAAVVPADPSSYTTKLATLQPGDTLALAPGSYTSGLSLRGVNGAPGTPITVAGPAAGAPATFLGQACCNTIELENSSFIVIANLLLDGQDVPNVFAIAAGGATTSWTHDITIDSCTIVHHDGGGQSQQTDGISTKLVSWNWIIRDNVIDGAGTGMYLGNSDATDAFFGGLIEGNFFESTLGYNIEIKAQTDRGQSASVPNVPSDARTTIIRNNVFIKHDLPACPSDTPTSCGRPNLLVDGFPDTGPGSADHYEIYANLFVHDNDDFLLQATGRVHVHDNIFIDSSHGAINFTDHAPKTVIDAIAYNNTIYSTATGISFSSAPTGVGFAVGNAIFAPAPFSGVAATQRNNVTDAVATAGNYVVKPGLTLGAIDFYPKQGSALRGSAMNLSSVATDTDYGLDFNGTAKDFTYRGAYTGEGANPGWALADGPKNGGAAGSRDGGAGMKDGGIHAVDSGGTTHETVDGGSGIGTGAGHAGGDAGRRGTGGDGGTDAGTGSATPGSSAGCGCKVASSSTRARGGGAGIAGAITAASLLRRRRRLPG